MKKNLIDRFQLYNKGMKSIDWNDVNVLRKLPDGWYSVPSDSEYGKKIRKDPEIKFNDSVEKASKRHRETQKKEREITRFIRSARLKYKFDTCVHKNYSYKGHQICAVCGLMKRNSDPFALNKYDENRMDVSDEDRIGLNEKSEDEVMSRMCDKARGIFERIIRDLSFRQVTIDDMDELLRVFGTYVLTSYDRGKRNFRISARPEGLCAALLWRELRIRKVPIMLTEFSERIKVDRMTVSLIVRRLDDYENFKFNKSGRPYGSKGKKK